MCSLERTHVSDPTPAIVSSTPTPAKSEPLVAHGVGVIWSRSESFEVLRSRSQSPGVARIRSEPESSRVVRSCLDSFGVQSRPESSGVVWSRSRLESFGTVWSRPESSEVGRCRSHSESSTGAVQFNVLVTRHFISLCLLSFTLCLNFVYSPLFRRSTRADSGSLRLQPIPDDSKWLRATQNDSRRLHLRTATNDSERLKMTPPTTIDYGRLRIIPTPA